MDKYVFYFCGIITDGITDIVLWIYQCKVVRK